MAIFQQGGKDVSLMVMSAPHRDHRQSHSMRFASVSSAGVLIIHLTETCDEDRPHLITHVETTPATTQDEQVTETIYQALEQKNMLPEEHLLNRGYVTPQVLIDSAKHQGVEVMGPINVDMAWQAQLGKGGGVVCFRIDWETQLRGVMATSRIV